MVSIRKDISSAIQYANIIMTSWWLAHRQIKWSTNVWMKRVCVKWLELIRSRKRIIRVTSVEYNCLARILIKMCVWIMTVMMVKLKDTHWPPDRVSALEDDSSKECWSESIQLQPLFLILHPSTPRSIILIIIFQTRLQKNTRMQIHNMPHQIYLQNLLKQTHSGLTCMLRRPLWGPSPTLKYDEDSNWSSETFRDSKPNGGQSDRLRLRPTNVKLMNSYLISHSGAWECLEGG